MFSFFLFSDPKSQTGNQIKGPASAHKEAGLLAYKKPFSAEKSFFQHLSLDFFAPACYNQRSFILFKMLMRTNRGPALHAAERAAPQGCCKQPAMCRTSTTAECRGEPLPGVPVTAQREALPGPGGAIRVEPWNAVDDFIRRFIPLLVRGEASFFVFYFILSKEQTP